MGNPILKIHTNGLLPLLLASLALPVSAQVSSENYVQTTQRISDTRVLATTQYYDGLDRPFEKVEQRVSPSGDNLIHYYIYDYRGNFAAGGWEHTYSSYTYAGSPQQTKHVHTANGKQDVVEEYDYAYDHVGRLVKTTYCVNGSDKRELSVVDYDNYGRILLENIMGKDEVLYDYNAQNMLTDSGYNEGDRQNDGQGNYDESLSYDKMGNVQSLLRSGLLDDGSYGLIDNLSYNYHGNQLLKVDDAAVGPYYQGAFHFVDGADEAVEYEYDANGNLVRDLNKGIISISYDLNNQPRKIEYNDGRNVSYLYDAEGSKLSVSYNLTAMSSAQPQMPVMQSSDVASANVSNGQKTIDYCGNIIYDGDETMILNDVGYALYDKDNNLSFHYYLKDHLGNNRVVVSENGEIEQVNDYYPTGALMASSKGGDTQRFKFNDKELDRTNGLNWYDYGARNYDAEIVVWKGVDKMADKNVTTSLYGYCNSNPIRYIDPLGTDTVDLLPSPQQDYRSYTLKLDAKYFDDDPNVINVWGHGDNDGIDYNGKTLSSARDFDEMLKEHSEVWKNHAQGNPAIIVLHSCSTADFAKILSASDLFRNVLIIGPTENVKVSFYKSKLIKYDRKSGYAFYKGHYENTKVETVSRWGKVKSGIWIGYRNGKYYNSYDGGEKTRYQSDEKPGGKGFEYRTLWDRIKSCF
nr:RHS repeat-associated core domain-containing protein [uncultured Prevotella sp.]